MRIVVDGRHLTGGRGIARFLRALLDAWPTVHPEDELAIVDAGRATFAASALTGRPRLDRRAGAADVFWAPAPAPLAVSRGVPFVLTVHDLSWIERPGDFTAYERAWHRAMRFGALVSRADRVVCDVDVVRNSIVERWSIDPQRVRVIPPGPGIAGVPHVDHHPGGQRAGRPYFLAVGALEPRKAPDVLLAAHARARAAGLRAVLVYAGRGRVEVVGDGVEVVQPSDEELRDLYAGALAVVHPAYLEGFAFPPIEGLAHGAPAIVADLPLYAETIGGGALRFPAGDEAALAEALLRIEREDDLRARLVAAGQAAIAPLSWERAARELRAVFAEVAR